MSHVLREIIRYTEHMRAQEWLMVLAAAILIGALCLRGYGSRSDY
jgi:hypothetical protein